MRAALLWVARGFGSEIVDARTGERLGRALLLTWRGRIHAVGLERSVQPIFLPQRRLTYWRQEIGFTTHPEPNYPHEAR